MFQFLISSILFVYNQCSQDQVWHSQLLQQHVQLEFWRVLLQSFGTHSQTRLFSFERLQFVAGLELGQEQGQLDDLHIFADIVLRVELQLFELQLNLLDEVLPLLDHLIKYFQVKSRNHSPCLPYSLPNKFIGIIFDVVRVIMK